MAQVYQKQFEFLKNKFEAKQLGHAYVFSGGNMTELKAFSDDIAKLLNCKFPDVMAVRAGESLEISIEQIRDVQNFLAYKSYHGGYKMVVMEDAQRMTAEAQNCFLKNLEEPKGDTLIILLSSKPEMMLPTIFSRCQQVKFSGVSEIPPLPQNLQNVLEADLAEKFKYAKAVNLEGGGFENILHALQHYWRKDLARHQHVLKLALDLERQVQISNINKKLALEILLLEA